MGGSREPFLRLTLGLTLPGDAADTLADEIRSLAGDVIEGRLDPNAGRVAIDALKWTASKLKPKEYGERRQVEQRTEVSVRPIDHCPDWLKMKIVEAAEADGVALVELPNDEPVH